MNFWNFLRFPVNCPKTSKDASCPASTTNACSVQINKNKLQKNKKLQILETIWKTISQKCVINRSDRLVFFFRFFCIFWLFLFKILDSCWTAVAIELTKADRQSSQEKCLRLSVTHEGWQTISSAKFNFPAAELYCRFQHWTWLVERKPSRTLKACLSQKWYTSFTCDFTKIAKRVAASTNCTAGCECELRATIRENVIVRCKPDIKFACLALPDLCQISLDRPLGTLSKRSKKKVFFGYGPGFEIWVRSRPAQLLEHNPNLSSFCEYRRFMCKYVKPCSFFLEATSLKRVSPVWNPNVP